MSIAPISQFFILSPRGDTIISKDYRGDAVAGTTDTFFRKVSSKTKSMSGRLWYNISLSPEMRRVPICALWQEPNVLVC